MFVFDPNYTFKWPVKVRYPTLGGDEVREFTGVFRLPEDEAEAFATAPQILSIEDVIKEARIRLAKYWVGWEGIELQGVGPLGYSEDAKATLLRQRPVREAVDRALTEAVMGIREKN